MKDKKLIFIFIFVLFVCCGCKGEYTLTYENNKFSENFVVSDLSKEDSRDLVKYDNGSEYLKIDDKNSYLYAEDGDNKIYKFDMGDKFVVSPLINTCFEHVNVVDKDDFINISASGEYYCKNYDLVVYVKTDKKVIFSNASSVSDNTYKWDNLENGLEIHMSKDEPYVKERESSVSENVTSTYIRLIICIIAIILLVFTISYLKKKNKEN